MWDRGKRAGRAAALRKVLQRLAADAGMSSQDGRSKLPQGFAGSSTEMEAFAEMQQDVTACLECTCSDISADIASELVLGLVVTQ